MEYAAKNNKTDSNTVENSGNIAESKHSLVKDKISGILRGGDQEQAAKQAASEAVSSSGDSSSVSSNKQSISQRSQIRNILSGATPITIPDNIRSGIEDKYSADFSSVRFYQDAKTTKAVNAKAYTYGSDVVLSPKYYQPNTAEGNKLIAHELAHVVQQNNSGTMQLQRDEVPTAAKGKLFEFNDSLNEIMRRRTVKDGDKEIEVSSGLFNHIYVVSVLLDTFKDEKKIAGLTRAIAADPAAKALCRKHGLAGIMALFDANIDAKKAAELLKTKVSYYKPDAILRRSKSNPETEIRNDLLRISTDIKTSARAESTYSNVPTANIEANWALTLSEKNLSSLKKTVTRLQQVKIHAKNGVERYSSSKLSLAKAADKIIKCRKSYSDVVYTGGDDRATMKMLLGIIELLSNARNSVYLASSYGIKTIDKYSNPIKNEIDNLQSIYTAWKSFKESRKERGVSSRRIYELDKSKLNDVRENIVNIRKKLENERRDYVDGEKSVQRIAFIIRYFISINDKAYKNGPTLDESKYYLKTLNKVPDDIKAVFGNDDSFDDTLYIELIDIISNKIKTRASVEEKSGKDPGIKVNKNTIEEYFKSIKKQSNKVVCQSYDAYAGGFFQHREIPPKDKEEPDTVNDVYATPVTVAGARMSVCIGYAKLGMHLLQLAGATPVGYIVWGEFTSENILANLPVYRSHVVAKVKRNGQLLYVSNEEIYLTEKSAFKSVGYEQIPTNGKKSIKSKGATYDAANKRFLNELQKKQKQLKK